MFHIFGNAEENALEQMKQAMKYHAVAGALMADNHLGYSVPIGGVLAYEGKISVNGVGFDIACGNKAVKTNADSYKVKQDISRIMNDIQKYINFNVSGKNREIVEHELFDDGIWNDIPILASFKDWARAQLGSVGSGNHYVDVFVDESDYIWIGVHFGSRSLGYSICNHFLKAAGGKDGINAIPVILDEKSDLGEQYIKCMQLAGRYAYAGRDWVCSKVCRIIHADILMEVHNHHNFAWKETHSGKQVWIIRKGATPNHPGTKSFVGGSMGDFSYILEGVEGDESRASLYSTIHGAGRVMARKEATGKINRKTGDIILQGRVQADDMQSWIKEFDVELRGGRVEEAPQCYKRIQEVLFYHRNTVKVVHNLKPIGVCMASGPRL